MAACTHMYYLECVLKLGGLGTNGYFADPGNTFDFFLVLAALIEEEHLPFAPILQETFPFPPTMLRVARFARVLRAVRLLRTFEGLRHLSLSLLVAFPQFLNAGIFVLLIIFLYGVLGVELFAFVGTGVDNNRFDGSLSFHSVPTAMQVLLECMTADGWSIQMLDALNPPHRGTCNPSPTDGSVSDCGSWLAFPYFISFMILGNLLLKNLIVAIILQNFKECSDTNQVLVSTNDIELFDDVWRLFDKDVSGNIEADQFIPLLLHLPLPFRPAECPEGDTPENRVAARKFVLHLVDRALLPKKYTQSGAFLNYRHVLRSFIDLSYTSYIDPASGEDLAPPPIVEAQPVESGWELVRASSRVELLRAQFADVSHLTQSRLARTKVGKGTQAEQMRALTHLVKLQGKDIDSLEVCDPTPPHICPRAFRCALSAGSRLTCSEPLQPQALSGNSPRLAGGSALRARAARGRRGGAH